jgi:parvulin-like peptidyl-prolyl isomerase
MPRKLEKNMPTFRPLMVLPALLLLIACSSPAQPAPEPAPTPAPAPAAPPPPAQPAAEQDPAQAALSNEACGQILVVAFSGALQAADTVRRTRPEAIARAAELLEQLKTGADFAELARKESDAPTSAARGGIMGTFQKAEWPEIHKAIKEPVFALAVGALADAPVEAEYGVALVRRCPVEKARSRHLLVRYKGAKKADGDIKRTKEQAKAFAQACLKRLEGGEDFAKVVTDCSNDASKERGGDIGLVGRGLLAPPYEAALFGMEPGERSGVIETDFGFHVIERLPD